MINKAPFTLYRITSERSDFYTGLGCCLHCATVIRYALRSENHSALEVIQKVIRYVPEQCKQRNPVCSGSKSAPTYMFRKQYCILYAIIMLHMSRFFCLLALLTISDKYINKSTLSLSKGQCSYENIR